jgi:poly-gamma-glutamate synthesis protein (capsule biosynthesis protein)
MRSPGGWFSQPYPPRDALRWVANNLWGPSRRHESLTRWLPQGAELEAITPRLTLAFVGDVMPSHGRAFSVAPALRQLFDGADLLVANFEGTLDSDRMPGVFMGQRHDEAVLAFLADLVPPSRTLLSVANNHAGDYGADGFARSVARLRAEGFRVLGLAEQPVVIEDGIAFAASTDWLNRPGAAVCRAEPPRPTAGMLRVLSSHWGYEIEAFPRPPQLARARDLVSRWDLVVGHHSHWPQPVTAYEHGGRRRLVAYSLGNFTFGLAFRRHLRGLLLTVDVGPRADGAWGLGRIRWWPTRIVLEGRRGAVVTIAPAAAARRSIGER